ncbi:MAG: hypothetical protein K2H33_00320 [Muribaculaceae bacterium]|nr:hypothetical protein [Muribaculaceae bacterium]
MFNKITRIITILCALPAYTPSYAGSFTTVAQHAVTDIIDTLPSALTDRTQMASRPAATTTAAMDTGDDEMTMDFGYCYDPASASVISAGSIQKFGIYIPAETCRRYAGATIEAAVIANGCIPNDDYADFKICFYHTLDDPEPFYSFDSKMEVRNHYAWRAHELPEPFMIEADKPFYLVTEWPVKDYGPRDDEDVENNFYPCAVDWALMPDDKGYSDLCYCIDARTIGTDNEIYVWNNLGMLLGNNCMRLRIRGKNLPVNDMAPSNLTVPMRITPEEEFVGTVILTNWGANKVTECVYSIQIGNDKPMEYSVNFCESEEDEPLGFHDSYRVAFSAATSQMGPNMPVIVDIVSVNSKPDGDPSNNQSMTATLSISDEDGYQRNLLVEESTGVWCGWCPMGIEGFDQMRSRVPDGFVGIAIHTGTDPMTPWDGSFDEIINAFQGGAPLMFVNNNREDRINPSPHNIATAYDAYCFDPAYVDIDIQMVSATADAVEFEVNYEFAGDADNEYSLIYAVTEDNVGPYPQKNDFPTGYQGEMFGWEKKEPFVTTSFNDVAVTRMSIDKATVFPDRIEGKVKYTDRKKLIIDNEKRPQSRKEVKPEDVNIIVAVINNISGLVENCAIRRADTFTSINAVSGASESHPDSTPEYFDMNGRRMNPHNLLPGIYLRRHGTTTTKLMVP